MVSSARNKLSNMIYLLIPLSGFAALSWEVIWQIKSTLALGVSAYGAAITLVITMGGISLGSFLMGKSLQSVSSVHALRLYGLLEMIIGVSGFLMCHLFWVLEKVDVWTYAMIPFGISLIYILGIIALCALPAMCMGATLPVFGLISEKYSISLAKLYGLNTFGAAAGVLTVAFVAIPLFGISHTIWVISVMNIMVGFSAWLLIPDGVIPIIPKEMKTEKSRVQPVLPVDIFIVFVTGFATFTLEIAWFRSLLSVYPNTTDIFAIILACMLIALGLSAKKIPVLKQKKKSLGVQMCIAGLLILLWTPLIERLGNFTVYYKQMAAKITTHETLQTGMSNWLLFPDTYQPNWIAISSYGYSIFLVFIWIYIIIVPAMRFLGVAFPWILDNQRSSSSVGKLYAINTLAAVVGSIGAAWILLPTIGFAKTAWIAGALVVVGGVSILPNKKRIIWIPLCIIALLVAVFFETGIGKTHVQGYFGTDVKGFTAKVLGFFEGPDATVAAIEYNDGARALLINSILAAMESGRVVKPGIHYMAWMGHLPMLLQPDPKNALVICFGTGQTANAVREENPKQLDIVDINSHVYELAHYFRSNKNVLADPKVNAIVMDGRAWLRRTKKVYDVITLEPLPPGSAGVNALYSKEFYELARKRLSPTGVIAQWLPFHGVAPCYSASIAKTFIQVFPNAILWIDPDSRTGILLGSKDNNSKLATTWPGFARTSVTRDLSDKQIQAYIALDSKQLEEYAKYGEIITDDNQLLSYGKVLYATSLIEENFELLRHIESQY